MNLEEIKSFFAGNWVSSEKIQKFLNLSFEECFSLFDFSRTAGWWSIVGETPEERAREGQKIQCFFRIKKV